MRARLVSIALLASVVVALGAQEKPPSGPAPQRVDVTPMTAEAIAGSALSFTAAGIDQAGTRIDAKPSAWFAAPFDSAVADQQGTVTFYKPGVVTVGALINGKVGFAKVTVRRQPVVRIEIDAPKTTMSIGPGVALRAIAIAPSGEPVSDVEYVWRSESPGIASVDAAGLVTGVAPGTATIRASTEGASATATVRIGSGRVQRLSVQPPATSVRTGDVVRFSAAVTGAQEAGVRWSISGEGASIDADGVFVAEQPGSYLITAISADRAAVATVVVKPRNVQRALEVVGRAPAEEFQTLEQWIVGNYAYVTSAMAGRLWVYDISNPAAPLKVDSVAFDARILNDVSTTADGKVAVITREGASNRKNGIAFLDTSDPAHPRVASEYTATVSGGVHSAFIDGRFAYITDDATGSLRVIDFHDVTSPREVGRWAPDRQTQTFRSPEGDEFVGGLMLHDVQVRDGLLYAGWWRDGLIVLDVGNGIKGGSPQKPVLVSQLRFNYHELYGPGWLAGAHAVFRYNNYVFVGDEVFPAQFDLSSRDRIPVQGIVHVVDVTDIERPRRVATYDIPEAGAHNIWVEDDVMYMGYYNAGARVVDVSGELRGNLYRQGREIARLWTGDPKGWRPNLPFCWGAQPHKGLIYFNDINSGIWITKLPQLKKLTPTNTSQ
ncbi:Bacterial Ig-like domain (group 2) [Luteitalea pratensis]|uniref:Bacterial Ig-like domain (Group 2) n=1 Tax=Luteitalea pratensis TaxID=1855912 RepID=A0A143PHG8_LUTPR|nr:Ig-like domain-containing protein [Luteitalea pratensis]AMY07693.1 Bacterial Ig-like domain (group 2) [Luteitalea pratensis]